MRGISKVAKVVKVVKVVNPSESSEGFGKLLFVCVLADQTLDVALGCLALRKSLFQPELEQLVLLGGVELHGDTLGLGSIVGAGNAVSWFD